MNQLKLKFIQANDKTRFLKKYEKKKRRMALTKGIDVEEKEEKMTVEHMNELFSGVGIGRTEDPEPTPEYPEYPTENPHSLYCNDDLEPWRRKRVKKPWE
jgi:hypothetical protein